MNGLRSRPGLAGTRRRATDPPFVWALAGTATVSLLARIYVGLSDAEHARSANGGIPDFFDNHLSIARLLNLIVVACLLGILIATSAHGRLWRAASILTLAAATLAVLSGITGPLGWHTSPTAGGGPLINVRGYEGTALADSIALVLLLCGFLWPVRDPDGPTSGLEND